MIKKRILFLGSHPQSFRCFRYMLNKVSDAEVIGIVPHTEQPHPKSYENTKSLATKKGIPVVSFGEIAKLKYNLGISVLFDRKLPAKYLKTPPSGFVNIHLGPLPFLRGSYSVLQAIRLSRKQNRWKFGVTLHYMTEEIDAGPIIDMLEIPILENDTAFSLHKRASGKVYELFVKNIHKLVKCDNRLPAEKQRGKSYLFKKGKINHEIDLNWEPEKIYDNVRALTFPGKPKPYIRIGKHRYYLSLEENS